MAKQLWSNSTETRKRRNSWRILFSECYLYLKELGYEAEDFDDNWKLMQAVLSIPKLETVILNDSRLIYKRDLRRDAARQRWIKRRESEGLSTSNPPVCTSEPPEVDISAPIEITPAKALKGINRIVALLSPPKSVSTYEQEKDR